MLLAPHIPRARWLIRLPTARVLARKRGKSSDAHVEQLAKGNVSASQLGKSAILDWVAPWPVGTSQVPPSNVSDRRGVSVLRKRIGKAPEHTEGPIRVTLEAAHENERPCLLLRYTIITPTN